MKRYLQILLLLSLISDLFSQEFTFYPNPIEINVSPDIEEKEVYIEFTKPIDSVYNIFWKLTKPNSFEPAWELQVCDYNTCYLPTQDTCSPTRPNIMNGNTLAIMFHFRPHEISGNSVVGFQFFGDSSFTNEVMATTVTIRCGTTATNENDIHSIQMTPNPASDHIQLTNGINKGKVVVYNIFGQDVKSFFHYNNAQHEIADLLAGMYVVKLLDDKNKFVKTLRFIKVNDGE